MHACLGAAKGSCCLIVPVDVPLISHKTLAALAAEHLTSGNEATVLGAVERDEPLIGIYNSSVADIIEMILKDDHKSGSVRELLSEIDYGVSEVCADRRELLNCNYPEDYCKAASAKIGLIRGRIMQ